MVRKAALVLISGATIGVMIAAASAQQPGGAASVRTFDTPEAAAQAFVAALQAPTIEPLAQIVGQPLLDSIPPEERRSDTIRRATGDRLAPQPITIAYEDDAHTHARAVVGSEEFKVPAPLVRTAQGWMFDGDAGIAEMRQDRIAANEGNALRAVRAYARAQEIYQQRDRDGNGILEYAQRIRGTPGHIDGLVNDEGEFIPGPATSLLNQAFARAEGSPDDPQFHPAGGYGYRILTAQGANAEGGALSYIVNGHMTEGFAIVAWPTRPGDNGESTFIMNQTGIIFEHEFGDDTAKAVTAIEAYDPGPDWTQVEE